MAILLARLQICDELLSKFEGTAVDKAPEKAGAAILGRVTSKGATKEEEGKRWMESEEEILPWR